MLIEEERHILEDLERLEEGIVERLGDEPKQVMFPILLPRPNPA